MPTTIYVDPLIASVTEGDVTRLFAQYGNVTKVHIPTHPVLGGPVGFGLVEMAEGAEEAIAGLNGTEFNGTVLAAR
jgi:RNA recognition motif-containing protein